MKYLKFHITLLSVKMLCSVLLLSITNINGQNSFSCNGKMILSQYSDSWNETRLFEVIISENDVAFNQIIEYPVRLNSLGFNRFDNYIYAYTPESSFNLFRLKSDGTYDNLGTPSGFIQDDLYPAADVSPEGDYVITGFSDQIAIIDVTGDNAQLISTKTKYYSDGSSGIPSFADIAFHPLTNVLYGPVKGKDKMGIIDPTTGSVTAFGQTSSIIDHIGALFFDINGQLFGYGAGELYLIDLTTGALSSIEQGIATFQKDGCSCPYSIDFLTSSTSNEICKGEIELEFEVVNHSGQVFTDISFSSFFPSDIEIIGTNILDNFGEVNFQSGTGVGFNAIEIENLTITSGITTFSIIIQLTGNSAQSMFAYQGVLSNFPEPFETDIYSDNSLTFQFDDQVLVTLENNEFIENWVYCEGDTATLPDGNTVSESGDYIFTYPSNNGCDSLVKINLDFVNNHIIENQITICEGDEYYVGETLANTSGIYFDTLKSDNGCDTLLIIDLQISKPNNDCEYMLSTAFSPNNDGVNDKLRINTDCIDQEIDFKIFNRWGQNVFSSQNVNDDWNGEFNNTPCPIGTYIYLLKFTINNCVGIQEEKIYKGNITLIR